MRSCVALPCRILGRVLYQILKRMGSPAAPNSPAALKIAMWHTILSTAQ